MAVALAWKESSRPALIRCLLWTTCSRTGVRPRHARFRRATPSRSRLRLYQGTSLEVCYAEGEQGRTVQGSQACLGVGSWGQSQVRVTTRLGSAALD